MLLYGKDIRDEIKGRVSQLAKADKMCLAVLRVGEDPASESYLRGMRRFADETGVHLEVIHLAESVNKGQVLKTIDDLNRDDEVTGVMIQTPLPAHLEAMQLVNALRFDKDVEGVHNYNLGRLVSREAGVRPSTPKAILSLLKAYQVPLEGQKVVVIGRSTIVGTPLALMMTNENATVTLCHSRTRNLPEETRAADILVVAVGKMDFVTPEMVREDMVVIDAGIHYGPDGKMRGDVHEETRNLVRMASAVPGGVGVVTVAELFDNLTILKQQKAAP